MFIILSGHTYIMTPKQQQQQTQLFGFKFQKKINLYMNTNVHLKKEYMEYKETFLQEGKTSGNIINFIK